MRQRSGERDDQLILRPGPWKHRQVSANGARFHVAEAGSGPLVLFLHSFPDFWWTWRHQLPAFATAGFRAVAMDLRGYGGSDKPPRGYDGYTLAGDVAGLIRALGERDAVVVGHGWGGFLAWTAATFHPRLVRGLAVVSAPHPLRLRHALVSNRAQLRALRQLFSFQLPRYEHVVTRDDAAYVGRLVHNWSGPAWRGTDDFAAHVAACRAAMQITQAAFCAMEYYRWAVRSLTRRSGWAFAAALDERVTAPVLQLHGAADPCLLPATARGSERWVDGEYRDRELADVGHFPHTEAEVVVTEALLGWARGDGLDSNQTSDF